MKETITPNELIMLKESRRSLRILDVRRKIDYDADKKKFRAPPGGIRKRLNGGGMNSRIRK